MITESLPLKDRSGKELCGLHDVAQQHLRALKAMGHEPLGAFFISLLELKLDSSTMFEWQKHTQDQVGSPHYDELLEFLNLRAQAAETNTPYQTRRPKDDHKLGGNTLRNKRVLSYTVATSNKSLSACVACNTEKHILYACMKFRALRHSDKMSIVKSNKLCTNCLKPGHFTSNCESVH